MSFRRTAGHSPLLAHDHNPATLASRRRRQGRGTGRSDADSSIPQVLRYSALAFGVFYGFSHQRSINAANRVASEKRDYEHKQQLIQKAKEEFAKKKNPAPLGSTSGGREYRPEETHQSVVLGRCPDGASTLGKRERKLTWGNSQPRSNELELRPGGILQRLGQAEPLELVNMAIRSATLATE